MQSARRHQTSNRSQQRAIRYIKGAEACGDPAALLSVPRKWQPFDVEQFSAVMQYSAGEMKRKLTTYREQCYEQGGLRPQVGGRSGTRSESTSSSEAPPLRSI